MGIAVLSVDSLVYLALAVFRLGVGPNPLGNLVPIGEIVLLIG